MDRLCLLHNEKTCARKEEIQRAKSSSTVRVMNAFDWGSASDNEALIYEEAAKVFSHLRSAFPKLEFSYDSLRGKDGSIYCDICAQIRSSDVVVFNLSTNNPNVILEMGLAVGFGTYVFVVRSNHYRKPKGLSDLNGILEYRFSRSGGRMKFEADFPRSLERTLRSVARQRMRTLGE
jgi:hypothetical protein